MALKIPAFTTLGFTISLKYFANSLATYPASPAYPPISAPTPVGIDRAIMFFLS